MGLFSLHNQTSLPPTGAHQYQMQHNIGERKRIKTTGCYVWQVFFSFPQNIHACILADMDAARLECSPLVFFFRPESALSLPFRSEDKSHQEVSPRARGSTIKSWHPLSGMH
ncbi:hypothetical protein VTH06DRAFT_571 [Thermothelomyces fergusii]